VERQIGENLIGCLEGVPLVLYTASDLANILLVPVRTVHKLVREKKLACVQVTARERRFTPEQVQQYIESRSTGTMIDKTLTAPVSSPPKKGGDRAQSVGVNGKDLREEMKKWR
jgi:excisionase family DNA binding protein